MISNFAALADFIGIFAFVVYFFAEGIVRAFAALGALEAFPPLIAALVCVSTLVFSIYRASTMLFSARELEITLAMPVRLFLWAKAPCRGKREV